MKHALRSLSLGFAAALAAAVAAAQPDEEKESECRPDEVDVGGYCVGQQPPESASEAGLRRQTPFRIRSMMPGHARRGMLPGRAQPTGSKATPAGPARSAETLPGNGFGVQLGAFSARSTAETVVAGAASRVPGPYRIAPLRRGERILWAAIHGPFPSQEAASAARARLSSEGAYPGAIIKPLAELELILPNHATTEE